jgi:hypothetical protein
MNQKHQRKHQIPIAKLQRNGNIQASKMRRVVLGLKLLWSLDVGAWNFSSRLFKREAMSSFPSQIIGIIWPARIKPVPPVATDIMTVYH